MFRGMVFIGKSEGWPHPGRSEGHGRDARGYTGDSSKRFLRGSAVAKTSAYSTARAYSARTLLRPSDGAHIRFCETNPPFCVLYFYVNIILRGSYGEKDVRDSVGSFWKTNPNIGGKMGAFTENEAT